jgi:transcription antitermination factor NusG
VPHRIQTTEQNAQNRPYLRGDGEAMFLSNDSNSQLTQESPTARWYAVSTAPCREKRVLDHLAIRQIESFLPLYRSFRKWKNGCRVQLESPLFPGYVFVRMPSTERVRVLEVPSVVSIVCRGRVPEPLDDHAIVALRDGIPLRNVTPHPYLAMGEKVVISNGPFAGLAGIVLRTKGSLRVVLTLELLMQSMAVEVNVQDIEPFRRTV